MIVEVRTYRIKDGRRADFLQIFQTLSMPEHRKIGMTIAGPFLDIENPDTFVFLRGFPSLEDREPMKNAFYEGPLWKNELESVLMPMIDSYDVILTEGVLP